MAAVAVAAVAVAAVSPRPCRGQPAGMSAL